MQTPLTLDFYREWLSAGYAGEMEYLKTHLPIKADPSQLLPKAKSVFVVTEKYFPVPRPHFKTKAVRLASYAQNQDYHLWLKEKLSKLLEELKSIWPSADFYLFSDSSPVLERDLALQAGLGWIGKNTCLIDRKRGSFFLIGGLFSTLDSTAWPTTNELGTAEKLSTTEKVVSSIEMVQDFCGTCNRCVQTCPTQALKPGKIMDATRCISYLTIESKKIPPLEIREKMGDHFFGCDICQTICPWNQKLFEQKLETSSLLPLNYQLNSPPGRNELNSATQREELVQELRWILTASGKKLMMHFQGTPLQRARPFGLKRNALIVAANKYLPELSPEISALVSDPKLSELANWVLQQISSTKTTKNEDKPLHPKLLN